VVEAGGGTEAVEEEGSCLFGSGTGGLFGEGVEEVNGVYGYQWHVDRNERVKM